MITIFFVMRSPAKDYEVMRGIGDERTKGVYVPDPDVFIEPGLGKRLMTGFGDWLVGLSMYPHTQARFIVGIDDMIAPMPQRDSNRALAGA